MIGALIGMAAAGISPFKEWFGFGNRKPSSGAASGPLLYRSTRLSRDIDSVGPTMFAGGSPIQGSSKDFPESAEDKQHDSLPPIKSEFWEKNERNAYETDKF